MAAKPSLLLLHGVTMSASVWDEVVPLLADDFDLIVPTAAGHRGGPALRGEATVEQLVDVTEELLDERGLATAHIAGNSLGGWMAIELARRGRALSVCALSPAGFWDSGSHEQTGSTSRLRLIKSLADVAHRAVPLAVQLPLARRLMLRDIALHGDRLTAAQVQSTVQDLVDCPAAKGIFATSESIAQMPKTPCPITVAWSAEDKILPEEVNGKIARERIPGARYLVLPGVGHVPMIDDPQLCATTICEAVLAGAD